MDFIKIPHLMEDGKTAEIILRISDIKSVFVDTDMNCSIVRFKEREIVRTPMSVAKIYDLIWQTQLSNECYAKAYKGVKSIDECWTDLNYRRIHNDDLAKCKELLRHNIIGNPKTERLQEVIRILDNAI